MLAYKPQNKRKETLLTCLSDLFGNIASQKKKVGVIAPKKFVARLRKENGKETMHVIKTIYRKILLPITMQPLNRDAFSVTGVPRRTFSGGEQN